MFLVIVYVCSLFVRFELPFRDVTADPYLISMKLVPQSAAHDREEKTTQGWVFCGVRRHAEPLGDNDPPRLGESAGGWGWLPIHCRVLVSNVRPDKREPVILKPQPLQRLDVRCSSYNRAVP